jgi:peptidoglycan/LPS O-acetylase OafA/YrhL
LLLLRSSKYRRIAVSLAVACAVVLVWRCFLVEHVGLARQYTYYATDTRVDSMLFGCIMGVWSNPAPALKENPLRLSDTQWAVVAAAALMLVLVASAVRPPAFRETLRYTLQGIGLFPIFYCAVRYPQWRAFSWLGSGPVRGLGLVSYTFYLCHLACIRITERYLDAGPLVDGLVGLIAAVAFSAASYYLLEQHLARMRRALHGR